MAVRASLGSGPLAMSDLRCVALFTLSLLAGCERSYVVGTTPDAAADSTAKDALPDARAAEGGVRSLMGSPDAGPETEDTTQVEPRLALRTWPVLLEGVTAGYRHVEAVGERNRLGIAVVDAEGRAARMFELDVDTGQVSLLKVISLDSEIYSTSLRALPSGWEILLFSTKSETLEGWNPDEGPPPHRQVVSRMRIPSKAGAGENEVEALLLPTSLPFTRFASMPLGFALLHSEGVDWVFGDVERQSLPWDLGMPSVYGAPQGRAVLLLLRENEVATKGRLRWLRAGEALEDGYEIPRLLDITPLSVTATGVVLAERVTTAGDVPSVRLSWRSDTGAVVAESELLPPSREGSSVWVMGSAPRQGIFLNLAGPHSVGNQDALWWTETLAPGVLTGWERLYVGGLPRVGSDRGVAAWEVRAGEYAIFAFQAEPRVFVASRKTDSP